MHREHDWDGLVYPLDHADRDAPMNDNDVGLETDQLVSKGGKAFSLPTRSPGLNDDVLPVHIPEFAQTFPQKADSAPTA